MKGKHAQKYFGAVGAMAPAPLSLKAPGGGGGAGGCCIQGLGPAAPRCSSSCLTHTHHPCLSCQPLLPSFIHMRTPAQIYDSHPDYGAAQYPNDEGGSGCQSGKAWSQYAAVQSKMGSRRGLIECAKKAQLSPHRWDPIVGEGQICEPPIDRSWDPGHALWGPYRGAP